MCATKYCNIGIGTKSRLEKNGVIFENLLIFEERVNFD